MTTKQKILIVDDDNNIAELISLYLIKECYETHIVNDGEAALKAFTTFQPDLILLDLMLPGIDGYQVCRELRKTSHVPIIMLSAKGEVFDKVLGLELGADDYIVKPLSMKEVVARVKAVLRRTSHSHVPYQKPSAPFSSDITYERLYINMDAKTVSIDGENIMLTKIEFELLRHLVSNAGRVFSRDDLLKHCWPSDTYVLDRTVDVNITRLRKKIGRYGKQIRTRFGYGYTFEK